MRAMIELILFTLVLFSCGSPEKPLPRELSRAESMMWEYPDSSLSLLNSISQCSIPDDRSYAIWALLVAQARDKVYGQSLPDSLNIPPSKELLRNALDYFERVRDVRRMAQSYFYVGQLYADEGEYTKAIPYYLRAKELMEKQDEPLFAYLICQSLGNMYRYQDLYDESLAQLKDAYGYAIRAKNGERLSYAMSELGRTYAECNELDSALYYFHLSLENAHTLDNAELEAMALGELGAVYLKLGEYEQALDYSRKNLHLAIEASGKDLAQAYYGIGSVFYYMNHLDSAKIYFTEALKTNNLYTQTGAYEVLFQISVERHDYEELINYSQQFFMYKDSLRKITHAKELAEIQAKYDFEKLENTANLLKIEKAHHERIGLALIICLIAMILIYQYCLLRKRRLLNEAQISLQLYTRQIKENKKLIAENEKRISSLTVQCAEVEGMRTLNDKLRDQNQFLQRRIDASNELLGPLYVNLKDQIPYFDKLMRLGTKPSYLEEKDWPLIRKWVDLQYDRFAERLERDFPDFTKLDMRYCWLIKMGFSSSQIAACMATSPTSSTKQKQRIKQRIKTHDLSLANIDFSLDDYIKKY